METQEQNQQQVEISSEQFFNWTNDPVTKLVVKEVLAIREQAKEYLASGASLAKDSDVTTDRMVGRIEGLTELFNLFHEVKEDAKEAPSYEH
jgi:hypothetical protein